jgi:hypothetical protein
MKEGNGGDRGEESEEWRMNNGTRRQIKAKRTKFTGNVHDGKEIVRKTLSRRRQKKKDQKSFFGGNRKDLVYIHYQLQTLETHDLIICGRQPG